ncbi:MAG: hypothetical protein ABIN55_10270 [Aeromicrobium sp.]
MTAVSVDELRRAWVAVEAGDFRVGTATERRRIESETWKPAEPVIVVAGATGRVGASTTAIALAAAANTDVRVVECSSTHRTGMMAATISELGVDDAGWRRGARDAIRIERTTTTFERPAEVPPPSSANCDLTIVDVGWDLTHLLNGDSWLAGVVRSAPLVLVSVATVPGLRALDAALRLTGQREDIWCAVVGPARRRWPRGLQLAATGFGHLDERGRLFAIPEIPSITLNGLTQDPLPTRLVSACQPILSQALTLLKGNTDHATHF